MNPKRYEVTDPVAGFREGEILDVTARFGDWHNCALKLETNRGRSRAKKVVVEESPAGFDEADVLDPTARFGDWHEADLTFDPYGSSTPGSVDEAAESPGPLRITMDQLEAFAEPVEPPA